MAGILIVAHAPLASALRDCLKHIYCGLPAQIGAIDVLPDSDPAAVEEVARAEIEHLKDSNGTLVFSDLYGATPANIAGRLASIPNVRVLSGVNLPMLLRAICYRTTSLDMLVEKTLAGGTNGIQAVAQAAPYVFPVPPVTCPSEHHAARRNHHHQ
ncbi:PTS sugar transporter subunit IIA [Robbsia andropogonis]|uniref:PTS sugar transporter subunit IIA n=1 Tax=Robbsia andropogonis TaxID=28092 RepID=UPI0004670DD2|nr:PTS sugar transporter subunit IIA [Robbsia andropogonis]MCP1117198.1 PTS sugar transporter subunit IIA [Robbsia andropogonis]MCP1128544.1 PTS sugar transporter subunit IIA [Robbsia andropogonis]